jgi:hypothetical protein
VGDVVREQAVRGRVEDVATAERVVVRPLLCRRSALVAGWRVRVIEEPPPSSAGTPQRRPAA